MPAPCRPAVDHLSPVRRDLAPSGGHPTWLLRGLPLVDIRPDPRPGSSAEPGPLTDTPPATVAQVSEILRRYHFSFTDEYQLQDGIEQALRLAGLSVRREVRLNSRDRIDLVVDRVGIEVKVAGQTSNVARQCRRYLESEVLDDLILVTNRPRHVLVGAGAVDHVTVVTVLRPW